MGLSFVLIVVALVILTLGAEGLVRGSSSIALRLGLTPLLVGLTVVAFGTSSPELVVSVKAALLGQGNIAVGNVVGSNIFNIGVILGLTALICPVLVKVQLIKLDVPIMVVVALVLPLLLLGSLKLNRWEGSLLMVGAVVYTAFTIKQARREASANWKNEFDEGIPARTKHWSLDIIYMFGGLALLVFGSRLLVDNCIAVAQALGISEAIIGLTIVAAGTSMPELATSVVAAVRKEPDIAIGNIVGSNIFNILAILGISSVTAPLTADGIRFSDYAVMIGLSILLLPVVRSGSRLSRMEGVLLLVCYTAYVASLWPK
jgi:cation:H+ antiporter